MYNIKSNPKFNQSEKESGKHIEFARILNTTSKTKEAQLESFFIKLKAYINMSYFENSLFLSENEKEQFYFTKILIFYLKILLKIL